MKLTCIALTATLLMGGTTVTLAQGQPTGGYPPVAGGANADVYAPGVSQTPQGEYLTPNGYYPSRYRDYYDYYGGYPGANGGYPRYYGR